MPENTRIAYLNEYRDALHKDDLDRQLGLQLAALDLDQADPDGPRLMDEIRGLHQPAAA
ncbi:hypothetical protein [Streptomyces bugieae]|uniref:Uncharacterized protein n=1 Tax=Streptomyces bugieae TaxID=3098223 RepID=A0ABU7NL22_9ACTN|nr:hypothetical protein [Streptomyces sp. DSM 41528]